MMLTFQELGDSTFHLVGEPMASVSPENLLEMKVLRFHLGWTKSRSLGGGPKNHHSILLPGDSDAC